MELRTKDQSAYETCRALIGHLEEDGHELRRPTADILRDGIHELRAMKGRVNYRILSLFSWQERCVAGTRPDERSGGSEIRHPPRCPEKAPVHRRPRFSHIHPGCITMKVPPRKKVTSAGAILDKIDEGHVNVRARVNEQTLNMRVAEMIYAVWCKRSYVPSRQHLRRPWGSPRKP